MKRIKTHIAALIIGNFLVLLSACTPQLNPRILETTVDQSDGDSDPLEVEPMIKSSELDVEKTSPTDLNSLTDLADIGFENADQIKKLGSIYPKIPPYFDISPDGKFYAKGELGSLSVFDVKTGHQISQFEVNFPHCAYGFEQYFQFSHDGAFISVITKSSIQVFQAGGGLIYESPHTRPFDNRNPSCGFDIPQVALSPDGKLLAVTGIDYSKVEPTRYFRVVDIIENEILYEWNGHNDSLHGDFHGFWGLGFSVDGQYIQTFDPERFILTDGELHQAFRFWSTKTWQEITIINVLRASFDRGELLFSLSNSDQVTIFDKLSGEALVEIPAKGCNWDVPCEISFSRDGTMAILLLNEKPHVQFGNQLFFQELGIFDLSQEVIVQSIPGYYRNLDGLHIADNGKLTNTQSFDTYLTDDQAWWVSSDHYPGLQTSKDGEIVFVPNQIGGNTISECQFCNTCSLKAESSKVNCRSGIEGSHGWYSIRLIDSEYWLVKHNPDGDGPVGKLSLQPSGVSESQRMRLLGYSENQQTAFYCLDMDSRPQTCMIDNLGTSRLLDEFEDISFLRMSPDGNFAAFIDSSRSVLFLLDLKTQKLSRRSHYQARAAFTNPVFSEDGRNLYYLVENLKNLGNFSIEILDVIDQKVIQRFSLGPDIYLPIAFDINEAKSLGAVANKYGDFVLFPLEQSKISFPYQTSQNSLIGIGFGLNDRILVAQDNLGILYLWGVEN